MMIRLAATALLALCADASAVTSIFTPSVQGEVITVANIAQTFVSPNNADRYLDVFELRGQPVNWATWHPTVDATIRLAVFRFDGTYVVGDALYTSPALYLAAGPKRPITFRPHVELLPNTTYLAVVDKLSTTPSLNVGMAFDANTIIGSGDQYGPGRIYGVGYGTYPFANQAWTSSGSDDMYFRATFNVPEPVSLAWVGAATLGIRRVRKVGREQGVL